MLCVMFVFKNCALLMYVCFVLSAFYHSGNSFCFPICWIDSILKHFFGNKFYSNIRISDLLICMYVLSDNLKVVYHSN